MSNIKKIKNALATLVLIMAVILCLSVVAQTLSKGYVTIFGRSMFRVATGSMEPTIPTGALLISKDIEINNLKINDIICFRSKESNMLGQVITHRVIDIHNDENGELMLETQGDANKYSDVYYVTDENLIGIVSYYTKEGNVIASIYSVISTRMGFLTFIVFPVLLISGMILSNSVKSIRKELDEISMSDFKNVNDMPKINSDDQKSDSNIDGIEEKLKSLMSEEEYIRLYEQLKEEILEDVESSVEKSGDE